ncbi:hypothetical protein NDU88_000737 [Pleurodeles waltl]|uniref:Uncharacterized protein n=1 Tax=Pleurodeles waltl TaxID=8319 RepID=A0AAV7U4V2_PLEWA|nr:hypothetical protein NDU88_000737 [Pleurodeles waltl]
MLPIELAVMVRRVKPLLPASTSASCRCHQPWAGYAAREDSGRYGLTGRPPMSILAILGGSHLSLTSRAATVASLPGPSVRSWTPTPPQLLPCPGCRAVESDSLRGHAARLSDRSPRLSPQSRHHPLVASRVCFRAAGGFRWPHIRRLQFFRKLRRLVEDFY